MENDDHRSKKDHLEEHSLPGTNQGPDSDETCDQEKKPDGAESQREAQLEGHSLPGTNQAGKGPSSGDRPAPTAAED
jgi:hypothetical protein